MLKAKAMNVRDIPQDGPSPRQDRLHLQLIVRCVPEFLRDVHQSAAADPTKAKQALEVFSRTFRTLQNAKIARTLLAEGIAPRSVLPPEFAESPTGTYQKGLPVADANGAGGRPARAVCLEVRPERRGSIQSKLWPEDGNVAVGRHRSIPSARLALT